MRKSLAVLFEQEKKYDFVKNWDNRLQMTKYHEQDLSKWIAENIFVWCIENDDYKGLEKTILRNIYAPLNIQHN